MGGSRKRVLLSVCRGLLQQGPNVLLHGKSPELLSYYSSTATRSRSANVADLRAGSRNLRGAA